MTKPALILIDIQNDYFPKGLWPVPDMPNAGANAAKLLAHAREQAQPVIHIRHEFPTKDAPFFRPASEGAKIHASVAPREGEFIFTKGRPNSFLGTGLQAHLEGLGIKSVTLCGAMSQMCVDSTARAAADLGYTVTVVADACAARPMNFNGLDVPAEMVHAAFMAPLARSFATVTRCAPYLSNQSA